MRADPHKDEVARLAARLEREHPVRLQMLAVVGLSGIAGFLVSFALLHLGLTTMAVRYAIATICGYGVFIACVRIWLLGRDASSHLADTGRGPGGLNLNVFGRIGHSTAKSSEALFRGGRSGGAGASAVFDAPPAGQAQMFALSASQPQPSSSGFSGLGKMKIGGGGKKGAAVIIVIALIALGIAVVGRVVWQSPNLLAEMLVDGAVAGSALRGVSRTHRHREIDVVAHTWAPALIVFVLMVAIGAAGQYLRPDAVSIGDVFR